MSSLIIDICPIEKLVRHPNADRLSIATVKGWKCIVGLNDHKEGDMIVFCPPDSVIPPEIIDKYNLEYLKKGGRVRTTRLRGYISQGLVLPLDVLPTPHHYKIGQNVANILGIKKYEPPAPSYQNLQGRQRTKKKLNPLFDKYTDIENIKNFHRVFTSDDRVVITEKVHGTNFRAAKLPRYSKNLWGKIMSLLFGKYEFVYGSHNVQLRAFNNKNFYGEDVYGKIAKKYHLAERIPEDYIVYGEIYGKKIQKLEYGLEEIDVLFFDVKYKGKYLGWRDFQKFCYEHGLPFVPVLYEGKFKESMLNYCTGGDSVVAAVHGTDQIREGCVVKCMTEANHPRIGRQILKSINPEYLAKKDRTDYH